MLHVSIYLTNNKSKDRGAHFFISHKLLKSTDVDARVSERNVFPFGFSFVSPQKVPFRLCSETRKKKTFCNVFF